MGEDRSWRVALVPNALFLAAPLLRSYWWRRSFGCSNIFADIHFDCPNESLEGIPAGTSRLFFRFRAEPITPNE